MYNTIYTHIYVYLCAHGIPRGVCSHHLWENILWRQLNELFLNDDGQKAGTSNQHLFIKVRFGFKMNLILCSGRASKAKLIEQIGKENKSFGSGRAQILRVPDTFPLIQ